MAVVLAPRNAPALLSNPAPGSTPLAPISILGTAFKAAEPDIFLTAKHVVDPWMQEAKLKAAQGGQPDQILLAMVFFPIVTKGDVTAWQIGMTPVTGALTSKNEDLAAFRASPRFQDGRPMLLKPLTLSKRICEEGDEVAACGFPFGLQLHQDQLGGSLVTASFSQGIVSAALPFPGAPPAIRTVFQMDAMINGGNSGGPVFDVRTGEVVGVATSALQIPVGVPGSSAPLPKVPTGIARAIYIHRTEPIVTRSAQSLAQPGQVPRTP